MRMICSKCGAEIESSELCRFCGHSTAADLQYYPTPPGYTKPCVAELQRLAARLGNVIDVGCGKLEFAAPWEELTDTRIWKIDLVKRFEHPDPLFMLADWLQFNPSVRYDVIMMNPPYVKATEFILKGRSLLADDGVLGAFLSQAYLSGVKRFDELWLPWKPASVLVFNRRIYFNGGCDKHGRIFATWLKTPSNVTDLKFINVEI